MKTPASPQRPRVPAATSCLLASLADPRLGGVLPGIRVEPAGLSLDEAMFGCCDASGQRLAADGRSAASCSLGTRLGALRRIAQRFEALAAPEGRSLARELTEVQHAALQPVLARLAALSQGSEGRGMVLAREGRGDARAPRGLSPWALAAAAAWRFGFEVHVVRVDKGEVAELVPRAGAGVGAGRSIVVVEGVQGLWESQAAFRLEYLVGWAYNAVVPVFLEMVKVEDSGGGGGGGEPEKRPRNVRQAFASRIGAQKARAPLDWLQPDAMSKLRALCECEGEGKVRRKEREREREGQWPKLPW